MAPFILSPHKAYLNSNIYLISNLDMGIDLINKTTDEIIHLEAKSIHQIKKLPAGEYCFEYADYSDTLIIEDAYKFGGSTIKHTYISENSPWCIIQMHDRAYFYNIESKVEYVEYDFSPSSICFIRPNVILASTELDHTLLSLDNMSPISIWQGNIIDKSEYHISIVDTNNKIHIYNLIDGMEETVYSFDHYKVEESLLSIVYNNEIIHLNLKEELISTYKHCLQFEFWGFISAKTYVTGKQDTHSSCFVLKDAISGDSIFTHHYNGRIACFNDYQIIEKQAITEAYRNIPELLKSNDFTWNYFNVKVYYISDCIYVKWDKYSCSNLYMHKFEHSQIVNNKTNDILESNIHDTIYSINKYIYLIRTMNDPSESKVLCASDGSWNELMTNFSALEVHQHKKSESLLLDVIRLETRTLYKIKKGEIKEYSASRNPWHNLGEYINTNSKYFSSYGITVDNFTKGSEAHTLYSPAFGAVSSPFPRNAKLIERFNTTLITDDSAVLLGPHFYSRTINALYKNIIGLSEKHDKCLIKSPTSIVLALWDKDARKYYYEEILTRIYDPSYNSDALMHANNKSVIIKDADGNWWLYDLELDARVRFDNSINIKPINGYRPIVKGESNRRLTIVDPVTLNPISPNNYGQYNFVSHDCRYHVANKRYFEYKSKETSEVIGNDLYQELCEKYREAPERKKYLKEHSIFVAQCLRKRAAFKNYKTSITKEINIFCDRVEDYTPTDSDRRMLYNELNSMISQFDFMGFFYDEYEYVIVEDSLTNNSKRLFIGERLWFLNYVAFSLDNRYVSITGKYNYSGVYFLFDLQSEELITRHTIDSGYRRAAWSCAFTKDNIAGFYSSVPNTYLFKGCSEDYDLIENRSLLCFSPSGRYVALSDKGYIPYNGTPSNWGHQSSTNIYIHAVENPEYELARYNDHADDIRGISTPSRNCSHDIGMVSFSSDDKKLLSVSYDGVVVVRNLRFVDIDPVKCEACVELDDLPF